MVRITNKAKQKRLQELRIMSELIDLLKVNIHDSEVWNGLDRSHQTIKDEQSRVMAIMREEY